MIALVAALFWLGSLPFLSTPWFTVIFFPFAMQFGLLDAFSEKYADVSSVARCLNWLSSFSDMSAFNFPKIPSGLFIVCIGGTIMTVKLIEHFFQRVGFDLPLAIAAVAAVAWVGVVYRLLDWGLTLEE
ncbi:putative methyltransferase [Megalodesulfovibrio gigas DSM 1382 = ATCC 19364]|uniref:Putative methyltransferase n=1 Tax=Megalodesulfovibrio gigas (strain ATCC 19364 / DSM 1382 / NCIMB 9332 / VKM B-1759) TaxID=1121448 RepID=T2G9I6_MEGG1|nr:putative methyltransferase [Megalodesulfovibrio gigas DSM 1382 = ATCC 19364]